jgi:hypothetical protein
MEPSGRISDHIDHKIAVLARRGPRGTLLLRLLFGGKADSLCSERALPFMDPNRTFRRIASELAAQSRLKIRVTEPSQLSSQPAMNFSH